MKPIPSTLYKYMSLSIAEKVLTGNRLRATPPNDFNDPFEMLPRSYTGMTDDLVYRMAEEKVYSHKYYQIVTKQLKLDVSYEAYRVYLLQTPQIIQDVAEDIKAFLGKRDFATLIDQASLMLGVLCFTSNCDNILMWSHYADNHKGVVIGFDSSILAKQWFPVDYQDERIDIPFGESKESDAYRKAITNILSTKFTSWVYENEFRFFAKLDQCKKENIGGKDMFFFELPANCTKSVICGAKMPVADRDQVRKLYSGDILDYKMDLKEFKLTI